MSSHWKAVLGVLLVFVLGCLTGWLGSSVVHYRQAGQILRGNPEVIARLLERRMMGNLNLDQGQRVQIHGLLLQNLGQRKQLQSQIQPQVQALNQQTLRDIDAVLRPEQKERLHGNLEEFKRRFGKSPFNPSANVPASGEAPK